MLTWKHDGGNLYFDESNILDNTQVAFGPNAVNPTRYGPKAQRSEPKRSQELEPAL